MKFCPICEMHMKRKGDFWECKNCNKQQNSFGGYPKKPVKNKDNPPGKFKLTLDSNDKKKLQKILS